MKNTAIALLLILLFSACTPKSSDSIVGKWGSAKSRFVNWEMTEDNQFNCYFIHGNDTAKMSWKYKIAKDNYLLIYNNATSDAPDGRHKFYIEDNRLYMWNFKDQYAGDHIDEVGRSERIGKDVTLPPIRIDSSKTIRLRFDKDVRGHVMINFNSHYGQEKVDEQGHPLIIIDSTRLVQTKYKEDPVEYLKGNILVEQYTENGLKQIQFYPFRKRSEESYMRAGYDLDSVYACFYDFNQAGREKSVNKAFGKDIKGNVLMLRLDTLKNMLENPYLGHESISFEPW